MAFMRSWEKRHGGVSMVSMAMRTLRLQTMMASASARLNRPLGDG